MIRPRSVDLATSGLLFHLAFTGRTPLVTMVLGATTVPRRRNGSTCLEIFMVGCTSRGATGRSAGSSGSHDRTRVSRWIRTWNLLFLSCLFLVPGATSSFLLLLVGHLLLEAMHLFLVASCYVYSIKIPYKAEHRTTKTHLPIEILADQTLAT